MSDLLEVAKSGIETIRVKLGPEDDWAPVMFVMRKDGEVEMFGIASAGGSDIEREMFWQSVVPSLLVEAKAVEVVIVTSAWMIKRPNLEGARPSESPDRIDCLVVSRLTREEESHEIAEVKRGHVHPILVWDDEFQEEAMTLGGRVVAAIRRGLVES